VDNLAKKSMLEPKEEQGASRDAFLGARVTLLQPVGGFRAGSDSVLLAAAVNPLSTKILELGAGAGAATCCVLADLPRAEAVLVDNNEDILGVAEKNLRQNGFADRAGTLFLDVTAKGQTRTAAGLRTDFFTSVIANPPFYDSGEGTQSPDAGRAAARHMPAGQIELWAKTAATSGAPGGEVIFIHLARALPELLASLNRRFGALSILPIVPRAGEPASRVLIRGIKGSRAPVKLLSPLILHLEKGHDFSPQAHNIFSGRARLDW
jgi:tRNA1(Val) A37 N6-methylase TrmN6